jgi:hypothetical protein
MMRQRESSLVSVLALGAAWLTASASGVSRAPAGPAPEPAVDLTVGWIERSQVVGCQGYRVSMVRGQALRILVDQLGVDVRITVDAGADREPLVFDGYTGSEGPDGGLFVSRRDGEVRVSVCGSSKGAAGYRIRREELRIATGSDRRLESAYRAYQRGREASEPETQRRAFEEARDGFRATGASREEGWTWFRIGLILGRLDESAEPEWEEAVAATTICNYPMFRNIEAPKAVFLSWSAEKSELAWADQIF